MTRATLLAIATLFAIARPAAAQTSPERIASATALLDEYVRTAIAKSPTLGAIRARQASARELVSPSGALPDPMVGIMYQSIGPPWRPMGPMSMVQGEISQMIPGAGKRQARRDAAQADAAVRKTELEATSVRIAADVRLLFSQIYASDKERQALESADQLLGVMIGAVSARFVTGGIDQEALAKAEIERSRLKEQLLDLRANREIFVAQLNRLLVREQESPVPLLDVLPELPPDLNTLSERQLSNSPELRVQQAVIDASVKKRVSAETETRPNFLVGFAGGATTSGEPAFTLRFGMELPIWSATKQEPLMRAARIDTEAAQEEYHAMVLKLRGALAELRARFKRDTEQAALYRSEIIPKATMALQAARNAYSTGRGDFSTVIEDYRLWLDAQTGLAKREADRLMTWAEYQAVSVGGS